MNVLRGAAFYTPDGDEADFKVMTGRVCDLVDALRRADMSGTAVPLSPETIVAAAFLVYKSEAIPRRYGLVNRVTLDSEPDMQTAISQCTASLIPGTT